MPPYGRTGSRSRRSSGSGSASTTRPAPNTRSMRTRSSASAKEASLRPGASSAAIPGAAGASTTRGTRRSSSDHREHSHAARGPASAHPQRAPLAGPALGLVDRGADDSRADAARAADREADSLDAEHAGARAADEGDPAQVQGRPDEAQRRADEVLQGEQHQPGRVVPAVGGTAASLHRPLLHAPPFREASAGRPGGDRSWGLLVAALRPGHHQAREQPLVGVCPARDLRAQPGGVDVLHVGDDAEVTALSDDDSAVRLHPVHPQVPDGARPVLDDDEPLDGRAGADHPPSHAEGRPGLRPARTPPKEPPPDGGTPSAETPTPKPSNGPPRRVKRKKKARR